MNEIKIRAKELRILFYIGKKISLIDLPANPTTTNTFYAELYYTRIVKQVQSILRLVYLDLEKRIIYDSFDIASIASITRDLLEAYNLFYYLCIERVASPIKEFRVGLYNLHHSQEITKILKMIDIDESYYLNILDCAKSTYEHNLQNNAFYKNLTQKQQNVLIKGKYMFYPFNDNKNTNANIKRYRALYKLFSNFVHSTFTGINHSNDGLLSSRGVLIFCFECSIVYFSKSIQHYFRLRKKNYYQLKNKENRLLRILTMNQY